MQMINLYYKVKDDYEKIEAAFDIEGPISEERKLEAHESLKKGISEILKANIEDIECITEEEYIKGIENEL